MPNKKSSAAGKRATPAKGRLSGAALERASAAREPSLSEQAYEAIKARILSLEYQPGQILN